MTNNLNPHQEAIIAMWLFGERYAAQDGGVMDFWKAISPNDKQDCRDLADRLRRAKPENAHD